jgi:hypothetical protein
MAMTTDRVPRVFPAGLSPAGCCINIAALIIAATVNLMPAS